MRINVGSQNQTKVAAVEEAVKLYPQLFSDAQVKGVKIEIEEFGHPKSLGATVKGAKDRAKKAFIDCDYSFGIEGGLMKVPHTKHKYMETGVCAIYNGKAFSIGIAPAIAWPPKVLELILSNQADGSQAFHRLGYTKHKKLGAQKGGILGVLTEGRMTREAFTKYSIISALIQLEKPEFYK